MKSDTNAEGEELSEGEGLGATPLMYACQQERPEDIRAILKSRPKSVLERDRTLKTALHYCAENASPVCAELILNKASQLGDGVNLRDAADEDGYTPLHLVVIAGNTPLLRFLIAQGADVNKLDNERHSIVHWATVCGEVEALEIVLQAGANPSTPDIHGGYPVHYAAQMCGPSSEMGGDPRLGLAVLRLLLRHNVSVHVQDQDGRQPILWAASAGSADAILALVKAGANVEVDDKDGLTALHCAASRGHTECLETLVSLCGANIDLIDSNGCTALFYAVTLGHADATQFLLNNGAHPNRQDRKGRTPAHCGAAKGQMETVRMLGAHGADLWVRNVKGDYPLHEAVAAGRGSLVQWLLSQRPDTVNAPNNDGRCPLHVAAINNNVEICKIILDHQGLVNPVMRTARGQLMTPLDAALHKGNRACAKYLQLHGSVPASKLTSHSAALRGPHRTESISDQMNTPESLTVPELPRGAKSLSSSPVVLDSKSRTVQVRITEDVRHHRQPDNVSGDERKRRKRRVKHSRNSDNSSDVDYNQEKPNRRKMNRTKHRGRRKNRSRSRHKEDRSEEEEEEPSESSEESSGSEEESAEEVKPRGKRSVAIERSNKEDTVEQNETKTNRTDTVDKSAKTEIKLQINDSKSQQAKIVLKTNRKSTKEETSTKKETVQKAGGLNGNHELSEKKESKVKSCKTSEKTERISEAVPVRSEPVQLENGKVGEEAEPELEMTNASKQDDSTSLEEQSTPQVVTAEVHQEQQDALFDEPDKPEMGAPDALVDRSIVSDSKPKEPERTETLKQVKKSEVTEVKTEKKSSYEETAVTVKNGTNETFSKEGISDVFGSRVEVDNFKEEKSAEKDEKVVPKESERVKVYSGEIEIEEVGAVSGVREKKTESEETGEALKHSDAEVDGSKAFSVIPEVQQKGRRESQSFRVLSDEDAESSQPVDSGFEPSPRRDKSANRGRSRPKRSRSTALQVQKKDGNDDDDEPNINVISVTQAVQNSVRKYRLERKIFNELLELKRLQIRAGQSNEQVMVKRLVDEYKKAGMIVGLRPYDGAYSFKHFERYLYEQLRLLQTSDRKLIPRIKSSDNLDKLTAALRRTRAEKTLLENIPDNPMLCTHCTHRCYHTTHAYTGIPCAAYISKLNHHQMPKPTTGKKNGFLPQIEAGKKQRFCSQDGPNIAKCLRNVDPSRPVTLELSHGPEKQVISLPTEKLDKNKRYYVTFTIKGGASDDKQDQSKHQHSSSL